MDPASLSACVGEEPTVEIINSWWKLSSSFLFQAPEDGKVSCSDLDTQTQGWGLLIGPKRRKGAHILLWWLYQVITRTLLTVLSACENALCQCVVQVHTQNAERTLNDGLTVWSSASMEFLPTEIRTFASVASVLAFVHDPYVVRHALLFPEFIVACYIVNTTAFGCFLRTQQSPLQSPPSRYVDITFASFLLSEALKRHVFNRKL